MESLPLKELDFGLQKRTGLSSGVGSPFHTLNTGVRTVQVYIIILYFYDYKVNRSTKSVIFTHFKTSYKKRITKKDFAIVNIS